MPQRIPRVLAALALTLAVAAPPATAPARGCRAAGGWQQRGAAGYYALVIGINDYKSLPKLKTAEADARAVAALLEEAYGFKTRLLLNATRAQIATALLAYRHTLGPDDSLLIYYAGHGFNDKDADKAYWLPIDSDRDGDSNWFSADDITTRMRAIPARHILLISDSCFSGAITRGLGNELPPPDGRERFIDRLAAARSRTLMASGGDEPVADGGGGSHSVFANALLRGLRRMDRPRFTAAELFHHHVTEPVAGKAQQTPQYSPIVNSGHDGGDFVFVRSKKEHGAEQRASAAVAGVVGLPDAEGENPNCETFPGPVFNPYPVTYDRTNTPRCHDFPMIDVANDVPHPPFPRSAAEYTSLRRFKAGEQLAVLLYINNGGADLGRHQAKNVKITTSLRRMGDLHVITAVFTGDNVAAKTGNVTVQTGSDEYLEIVPNSGFMYDHRGRVIEDSMGLNIGNSILDLGGLDPDFEYALFFTYKVKVLRGARTVR